MTHLISLIEQSDDFCAYGSMDIELDAEADTFILPELSFLGISLSSEISLVWFFKF